MEVWDVYDRNRQRTGRKYIREEAWGHEAYHLIVHVCIFDAEGRMLIQKRKATKRAWGGLWDVSAGGSALFGEDSWQAAERETMEELGLQLDLKETRPRFVMNYSRGFDDFYAVQMDVSVGDLRFQETEVEDARYATRAEVEYLQRTGGFVPYFSGILDLIWQTRDNEDGAIRQSPEKKTEDGRIWMGDISLPSSLAFSEGPGGGYGLDHTPSRTYVRLAPDPRECERKRLLYLQAMRERGWVLAEGNEAPDGDSGITASIEQQGYYLYAYFPADHAVRSRYLRCQGTEEADLDRCVRHLWERGWTIRKAGRFCGGKQFEMERRDRHLFLTRFDRSALLSVIMDAVSGTAPEGPETRDRPALLCQYGLCYGPMVEGVTADCGMLYLLRLEDGRVFIIDGGEREQAGDAVVEEVLGILRKWCAPFPVRVAGWLCTHPHDDHMDLFGKLLAKAEGLILDAVYLNFPGEDRSVPMVQWVFVLERLRRYAPHAPLIQLHAGQVLEIGGMKLECLQTHEELKDVRQVNDLSAVVRLTLGGVRFLITGDLTRDAADTLMENLPEEAFKCDILQAAHHLFNRLEAFYPRTGASLVLVPQGRGRFGEKGDNLEMLREALPGAEILFASDRTCVLELGDGQWREVETLPSRCEPWDGSAL